MRLHLFALLLFISGISIAQSNSIVIVSESGEPFLLKFNQEFVNNQPQSIVKVFEVSIGWQHLEIEQRLNNQTLKFKDSLFIDSKSKFLDKELTYALVNSNNILELRFKSVSEKSGPQSPNIPEAPKEKVPLVDNSLYGILYQAKNNKPIFFDNYNYETQSCKNELTDKEITYALNLLNKYNDDEIRTRYTNEIVEKNCYTVQQIKQLIDVLNTDLDRLNVSKKAYTHLSDKQNVSILLTSLKYKSMKESFQAFLNEQENIIKQKSMQCKTPIDDKKFEEVLAKIKNGGHENEKVIVAKKLMVNICISSVQAKKIAQFFSHDRETMDVLKSAYNILTDKENAKNLVDEFQFKESKDEYLKYISGK